MRVGTGWLFQNSATVDQAEGREGGRARKEETYFEGTAAFPSVITAKHTLSLPQSLTHQLV